MKIQEFKNLRQKNDKELGNMLKSLKTEVQKITLEMGSRKLKNVSLIKVKKKEIAQIKTLVSERKHIHG
ncbi:50S ribosomal protein L29 [Candidatus Gottesmanbacteria bacterium RIFCSPHIGHO2_01_FULL_39_10]|uniref:Large ribosomal subunit protein uL29 n=1 Tax=Candidatus Gottesmanbacteria bacterium RIFCSPHIGHO2_01_FULL_39_10 TaxID=1798375 RepID=A0A1F5ZRJ9_9BACT|nr:MAG: 50S ribosomal protein L29 [Candidatus Gottesmanbacteria bacterium RIFCSPHIGHO2_01_FULL_39_10]